MGGKGGGGTTTTTNSQPPADVLANYDYVTNLAKSTAQTPYTPYSGQLTAGLTNTEQSGINNVNNAQGTYQPYFNNAQSLVNQGTQQYTPTPFSAGAVSQYESPYNQDVIKSTLANINQNNAEQQQSLTGNAISSGAWGGDRAQLAKDDLARQQDLATNQTIAGLENQNYTQALGQYNQANTTGLQAAGLNNQSALSGAGIQGALGTNAQQNTLSGAGAQLQAGALEQGTNQNALTAQYGQFQNQLAYPFNTTQWLSNITTGLGSQSGGTSTSTQSQPQSNSIFGFLGLKDGGRVPEKFGVGGGISNFGSIPDFSQTFIPVAQPNQIGETIPKAAEISNPAQKQPTLTDLISAGKNVSGLANSVMSYAKGLGQFGSSLLSGNSLGESAAYAQNAAGFGNAAYDSLSAADAASTAAGATDAAASAAGSSGIGDAIASLFAMLHTGGRVNGYSRGGITGYADGGAQDDPTADFRNALFNTGSQYGLSPATGDINNSPLFPPNYLGGLSNIPMGGSIVPTAYSAPNIGSTIPTAPSGGIQGGNSIPAAPAPQTQTATADDNVPALENLQSQLAGKAPVLDKDQAILTGVAGFMAGKNRGLVQNIGEGMQAGLGAYAQQKQNVADYALKEAEAETRAQQLAVEAERYNKQLQIEQENADTTKSYKDIMAKNAEQNTALKDIVPIKDKMGGQHLVRKTDLVDAQKTGDVSGAQNEDGTFSVIPDKLKQVYKDSGLAPSPEPINKFQAKSLNQHYDDATKADEGAREASTLIDKIYPALQNYSAGTGSDLRTGAMAAASSILGTKTPDFATNAQEINKVSGTLATQLAAQMPSGSRVGIGVDNLFKSTTISPTNSPEANLWIAKNIKDTPAVTSQVVDLKAYLAENNVSPAHANAIEHAFFKENPVMVPSPVKGVDRVNPKFQDPDYFSKWLGGKTGQVAPEQSGQGAQQYQEGQTATGPNGQKLIFKNGAWVAK